MKIDTAMILAAGRGERMRPLTDTTPKPLLQVGNKTLIEHHINALEKAGIHHLVINHAYLGEKIEAFLGSGEKYGVRISYSAEGHGKALETGGGIFNALPLLGDEPFVVVNADIWTDYNFSQLSINDESLAHLVLVTNPEHNQSGDFAIKQGKLVAEGSQKLTYSGIGIYRAELFKGCSAGAFPLAPLLREAMKRGLVSGEYYPGVWLDVGTPERLMQIENILAAE